MQIFSFLLPVFFFLWQPGHKAITTWLFCRSDSVKNLFTARRRRGHHLKFGTSLMNFFKGKQSRRTAVFLDATATRALGLVDCLISAQCHQVHLIRLAGIVKISKEILQTERDNHKQKEIFQCMDYTQCSGPSWLFPLVQSYQLPVAWLTDAIKHTKKCRSAEGRVHVV